MLALAKRSTPEQLLARSAQRALLAAKHAAQVSSAYRTLLGEHKVAWREFGRNIALSDLPILTKSNTFERFELAQLCRPLAPQNFADVLTSSGRGGQSFGFRITTHKQFRRAWFEIDLGLQDAFDVDTKPTLLVNCLPMGVVLNSRATTVANLSVREDMACAILRNVGKRYAQTLLCTDPLFIRRLLDQAQTVQVDWAALNTSVIVGEEMLAEAQRDFIALKMGIDLSQPNGRTIISSFGIGELGLNLLFETRETVRMRRALRENAKSAAAVLTNGSKSGAIPSIFCFNPLRCHIEVLNPGSDGFGELCFTMLDREAVIPLPRYSTGDLGRLMSPENVRLASRLAGTSSPWLPVVAVKGRLKDRSGAGLAVEDVKELIYQDAAVADLLTGAFRIVNHANGPSALTIQANTSVEASILAAEQQLSQTFAKNHCRPVQLSVVSATNFPHRPTLDFERKFAYVDLGTN